MDGQVYKKIGRRYKKIGYSDGWSGFPSDGIWVVQTKDGCHSSECMIKIGEVESLRPTLDMLANYKWKIIKYMMDSENVFVNNISYDEFVSKMIKEIAKDD